MAKKLGGLGRDFYDIYSDNNLEKGSNQSIRISDIEPRRDQPRKQFDEESLETLADSIAAYGVLQPIIVRESEIAEGTYEIIAGERRWRASKMAGLTEIPAIVFDGDELKAAQVALIENIQREDLNPVEEAFAYGALIEKYGLTQDQVAKQVGKSRPAVANALRLLELPDEVLEMLKNGDLSAGHARALLGLHTLEDMRELADLIVEKGLSVRAAEEAVRKYNRRAAAEEVEEEAAPPSVVDYARALEGRVMAAIGRRVKLDEKGGKRTITFYYEDNEDLEDFLRGLCGNDFFDGEL